MQVAGVEVLRRLRHPVGYPQSTWSDLPRMAVRPLDANRILVFACLMHPPSFGWGAFCAGMILHALASMCRAKEASNGAGGGLSPKEKALGHPVLSHGGLC